MKREDTVRIVGGVLGLLILIFDGKTAVLGIREGIKLCIHTLIPALFPFCVLSLIITGSLVGKRIRLLRPVMRFLGIPEGAESLLLVGWLGGYPVGAQNVASVYRQGKLTATDAAKLAIVCNNAGPSFIFGVMGSVISDLRQLFLLWFLQIISSVLIAVLIPCSGSQSISPVTCRQTSLGQTIRQASVSMLNVCSCVILFRMVLEFLQRWIFWALPESISIALAGVLELSNGCIRLASITNPAIRFILAAGLLSFGGICVWMQTLTVCDGLDLKKYLLRKALQSVFCVTMALWSYRQMRTGHSFMILVSVFILAVVLHLVRRKKHIAFSSAMLYNNQNATK